MPLKILQTGERVLREKARPLSIEEIRGDAIQQAIEVMKETMYAAPGVGLAAPQVGLPLQLAVIEDRAEYTKDISAGRFGGARPAACSFSRDHQPAYCGTQRPGRGFFRGLFERGWFQRDGSAGACVVVECLNEKAEPVRIEADGWYARILQHEIDHLHGILYIDRMAARSFTTMENFNLYWKDGSLKSW